jgi:hypothetical protein
MKSAFRSHTSWHETNAQAKKQPERESLDPGFLFQRDGSRLPRLRTGRCVPPPVLQKDWSAYLSPVCTASPTAPLRQQVRGTAPKGALILGFCGELPETVEVDAMPTLIEKNRELKRLLLPSGEEIEFIESEDLDFARMEALPCHPNGMQFTAFDKAGNILADDVVYSLGRGVIVSEKDWGDSASGVFVNIFYPFDSAKELLEHCTTTKLAIADLILANEACYRPEAETSSRLGAI